MHRKTETNGDEAQMLDVIKCDHKQFKQTPELTE